ncbi:MAG: aminotransferase class I/II-fold pyridoxal phosphate-dependent enzyme [Cytophagales bacterium]|nr:aminotransferase class I/II-fold pyridoxal phosphate-dependent enzyme [Cytophagales bacterium]
MRVDLRSDTVTRPTPEMLDAMMSAKVGDDVFGDDPTVNALQEKAATVIGMEAAIYCPSGTMTNQIGMRVNTRPQDEVICHKYSHVYLYEAGGMMSNSMISPKLLEGDMGRIRAQQVAESINPDDSYLPRTQLVVLENTMNKGAGSIYDLEEMKKIKDVCDENSLKLHLDGARLFNALAETGESPIEYGQLFDTISICFSKGLGAPVGSVLLGNNDSIRRAMRVRKSFGGGMRQAGYLAAACIYALDHNLGRLKEDHERARRIGEMLQSKSFISEVLPISTNIVIAELADRTAKDFLSQLEEHKVSAVPFGPNLVRFVTHLDFTDDHLAELEKVLQKVR